MNLDSSWAIYGAVLALIWAIYVIVVRKGERYNQAIKTAAVEAGLTEPASIHPQIDPAVCLGCGACERACPEGDVLGLLGGKAELLAPTHCIGHGECARACPTGAITLVFGTAKRGVDLPQVNANFETNVPGIFVAGELGGMGLIRNAVEQGRQAVEAIRKRRASDQSQVRAGGYDLIIAGAGPAGIAAALTAKSHNLNYLVIEQDDLGGAVFKYPRGKVVMTAPVVLPLAGSIKFRETTKESLLAFWHGIVDKHKLAIRYRERIDDIVEDGGEFAVRTSKAIERASAVLLAIGRRGTPRTLDVPGEDLPKVVYQMIDPEQYRGQHVLVVGGGDSALEAAVQLAAVPDTVVTMSYRAGHFARARLSNREKLDQLVRQGRIRLLMPSELRRIDSNSVDILRDDKISTLPNDAVIICAGGILPTEFLRRAGIAMETKYGTP